MRAIDPTMLPQVTLAAAAAAVVVVVFGGGDGVGDVHAALREQSLPHVLQGLTAHVWEPAYGAGVELAWLMRD